MTMKTPQDIVDELLLPKKQATSDEHKTLLIKKEAKIAKSPPIISKRYYTINVEALIPATLTYRVLAETPEQAVDLMRGLSPTGVRHKIVGKKDLKLTVAESGSSMIKLTRNLSGR